MAWLNRVVLGRGGGAEPSEPLLAGALVAWNSGDYGIALDLWVPLARSGSARAQSNMGATFLEGRGVGRDPEAAVRWLRLAADQGDAGGQRNLALCHYEGWGVAQDHAAAARWAEKAAGHGRAGAMARLGDIHHNALGVARDPAVAASWRRRAAALGHAEAQAMLGAAFLAGKGVPADPVEAWHWLLRAQASYAGKLAAGFLREALARTKPVQRREAERRATEALP